MRLKMLLVEWSNGKARRRVVEMADAERIEVGRRGSQLRIADPFCSNRHALLYFGQDGELRVRDLKSRNGTRVDGGRIEEQALHPGSRVRIGRSQLVVL